MNNGLLILGSIRDVRDYELLISLPHKNIGSVPITQISLAYNNLLKKVFIIFSISSIILRLNVHNMLFYEKIEF